MTEINLAQLNSADEKSKICNDILRSLPEWFGIESAIIDYVNDVKEMDTWVAKINDIPVGFISINKHNQSTAEIHVMGILETYHNQKIGSKLVSAASNTLATDGFTYLSVKTLSESREDANYAKTRKFYLKNGFLPVEEFKTLWGEENPCLFLIKNLTIIQKNNSIFNIKSVAAVMIHVSNCKEGLLWYQKAFPEAKHISLPEFNFECLQLNGINIEVVEADEKVGAGTYGLAVDWEVSDFDQVFNHFVSLGATLYRGPMNIENGRRMCKLKDPFGNLLGLRGP